MHLRVDLSQEVTHHILGLLTPWNQGETIGIHGMGGTDLSKSTMVNMQTNASQEPLLLIVAKNE